MVLVQEAYIQYIQSTIAMNKDLIVLGTLTFATATIHYKVFWLG